MKGSATSVGIDIGGRFIKVVELRRSRESIVLHKFGIKEISRDLKEDRDKIVPQLISQLLSESNIKTSRVNVSVGGQSVFVRFVKLLQVKEEKLNQTMKFEAQNQIPFPLAEVAWDWSLLDKNKKGANKKAVLVAVKKNIAEEMASRLKQAKLSTKLIDVSPISLYNCMAFNEDYEAKKLGAILDIGAKTTNLVIFKEGNIWIRSFPIAGERIEKEGEQGIEEFLGEIERSIEYYFMQSKIDLQEERKLDELILTGGATLLENIESKITSRLNIKPRVLDPFRKLRIAKDIFPNTQDKGVKSQLAVAVGLALRNLTKLEIEVNFLKEILSEKYTSGQRNLYSRLSIAMAVLTVISFSVFMRQDYSVKRLKLNKIDEMLDTYAAYEPKIEKIEDSEDILKEKINILRQITTSRALWMSALKVISEILPEEVWITDVSGIVSLERSGFGRLDLAGKALSYNSTNSFVSALKSLPNFKDVKPISSSIETDEITNEEIVRFSITMDVVVEN